MNDFGLSFFLGLITGGGIFLLVGIGIGGQDFSRLNDELKNNERIKERLQNKLKGFKNI
jgi:hypothetical protein